MADGRVIVISNDIVPGMGMPVAAPGLRAHGLASGLRAHGLDVTVLVPAGPVETVWQGSNPPPTPAGTVVMNAGEFGRYASSRGPTVVVFINGNQASRFDRSPDLRFVLDVFSPQLLEFAYGNPDDAESRAAILEIRDRKRRAFDLADAVVVNGAKKVPYVLAWMVQSTEHWAPAVDLAVVPMPVDGVEAAPPADGPVRLAMTGYLQGWSVLGSWLETLAASLDPEAATLDVVLPVHWGQSTGDSFDMSHLDALAAHPAVMTHPGLRFDEFRQFLRTRHVAVDLFGWTLEREYAMVTRSAVALATGLPVLHPPFTEISPLVDEYDAGWLVDPDDREALEAALGEIIGDRAAVQRKAANARRLWEERLEPMAATRPLATIVTRLLLQMGNP